MQLRTVAVYALCVLLYVSLCTLCARISLREGREGEGNPKEKIYKSNVGKFAWMYYVRVCACMPVVCTRMMYACMKGRTNCCGRFEMKNMATERRENSGHFYMIDR